MKMPKSFSSYVTDSSCFTSNSCEPAKEQLCKQRLQELFLLSGKVLPYDCIYAKVYFQVTYRGVIVLLLPDWTSIITLVLKICLKLHNLLKIVPWFGKIDGFNRIHCALYLLQSYQSWVSFIPTPSSSAFNKITPQ